jgi:hypothetical protein
MNPVNFSRDSLHWRLATVYGDLETYAYDEDYKKEYSGDAEPGNLCDYVKNVGKGLFKILLLLIASVIGSMLVGNFIAWVLAMIVTRVALTPDPPAVFTCALILLVLCAMLFGKIYTMRYEKKRLQREDGTYKDSFISEVYKKWKTKTCVRVIAK